MVKISLECTLIWWQVLLGRTQKFQNASVIACHLDVLIPFHDKFWQTEYNYALS